LVPSTQKSGNPAAYYVEGHNMMLLGQLTASALRDRGFESRVFWSEKDDLDTLKKLYQEADAWVGEGGIVVSQHSDSGNWSHVFGIYGRERPIDRDPALAARIVQAVGKVFETKDVRTFRFLGTTDYATYLFVTATTRPSVLIEYGSHMHEGNLAILTSEAGRRQLAQATVDGIEKWYEIQTWVRRSD